MQQRVILGIYLEARRKCMKLPHIKSSRDSSVGVADRLRDGKTEGPCSNPDRGKASYFTKQTHPTLETMQFNVQRYRRGLTQNDRAARS
jgi:hypothetical protein